MAKEATDEWLRKAHKRAFMRARTYGINDEAAKDIAQDVVCNYASGKGKSQTIDQAVIDAIRKKFGSTRSKSHHKKQALEYATPFDRQHEQVSNTWTDDGDGFRRAIDHIQGVERALIVLYYLWGLSGEEIAFCFRRTEGWVSIVRRRGEEKIRERIKAEVRGATRKQRP